MTASHYAQMHVHVHAMYMQEVHAGGLAHIYMYVCEMWNVIVNVKYLKLIKYM